MTPKTRRHSAFKIKRLVPRNRWKFPRSSVATIRTPSLVVWPPKVRVPLFRPSINLRTQLDLFNSKDQMFRPFAEKRDREEARQRES